ncbi:MAG: trigger factor [Magnetococcales bacterium]|nr:trigger factor [Magnetococcales bacterium]
MEVTVEETGALDRTITVRVEAEQVNQSLDLELQRLAGSVKLPGFRPGKTPRKHLETRFKDHLAQAVMERLMHEGLNKAVKGQNLRPADDPEFNSEQPVTRGQPFVFTVTMQIMPEVKAEGYREMALTRPVAEVTDADVAAALEQVRERRARYEAVEGRQAASGDQVVLNFKGFVDDEPFPGGEAEGYVLELGSGRFIPGFEDQLIGIAPGENRDVKVSFPESYSAAHLAGKEALFQCSVTEVRTRVLPEIDDALAMAEGITEGGLERLRESIREQLTKRAALATEKRVQRRIHDALVGANPFELPSKIVEREVRAMVAQFKEETVNRGMDPAQHGLNDDMLASGFRETAERRVRLGLLLGAIAKQENMQVDDARVAARLDALAAAYGAQAREFKQWARSDESRMDGIRGAVLEEMVNEWILGNGTVTDETIALDALLTDN